jgi:hypothetical protein
MEIDFPEMPVFTVGQRVVLKEPVPSDVMEPYINHVAVITQVYDVPPVPLVAQLGSLESDYKADLEIEFSDGQYFDVSNQNIELAP